MAIRHGLNMRVLWEIDMRFEELLQVWGGCEAVFLYRFATAPYDFS